LLTFQVRFCSSLIGFYTRQRLRGIVILCELADNTVEKPIKRCRTVLLSALFSLLLDIRLDY
ncbi:hypothetical protein, partial [Pseudoalteromonas sp. P1-9]|uniref:hypothetical protein n=1 Tax=Pseudoalteromonas sp. P1-9 TaxID=1710354 RepID=UPI001F17A891